MIDIKTLRIGNHVEYKGRRVRVALVREGGCICEYKDNGQDVIVGLGIEKKPIPITSDLLKELGFKWRKDSSCWRKKVGKDYWIFANGMDEVGWQFLLFPPYEKIRKRATLYADNLHEIEGQLAYYGVELIKE